ncbi:MAG: DNA-3-methyladenine glycosylase [Dehalococcoidia bacterium]
MLRSIDIASAESHLSAADPIMASLIAHHGPVEPRPAVDNPFMALCRSITYQQLSGKAAGAIFGRLAALAAPGTFPTPAQVLGFTDEQLRAVGQSRQKVAALRSLAAHFTNGDLGAHVFEEMDDESVIERLLQVRGIGRWSAEMFLMFQLQRPDVLPVNDLAINRAIMQHYGLDAPSKPAEVRRIGEPWRPWASVACLHLWQSQHVALPE